MWCDNCKSVCAVVTDTGMESAIGNLDSYWILQFWVAAALQLDQARNNECFRNYVEPNGTENRLKTARRHKKNVLEYK